MYSETYKGRTITIDTDDSADLDYPRSANSFKRVRVNGAGQFSYRADDAFILAETRRYIDAVDLAAERFRQKSAAGAYVATKGNDFADSWRAA